MSKEFPVASKAFSFLGRKDSEETTSQARILDLINYFE